MARWVKILICAAFSFIFVFMSFGYAAMTDIMDINGVAMTNVQEGIFITNAVYDSGEGTLDSLSFLSSVLTSKVQLQNADSTVSIAVTVFNNTTEEQYFDTIVSYDNYYDNSNIIYTYEGLKRPYTDEDGNWVENDPTVTKIAPQSFHSFIFTFKYKDEPDSSITSNILNSSVNFIFKTKENISPDKTIVAVEGTLDKFKNILNNSTDMSRLLERMANRGASALTGTGPYIGNVAGNVSTADTTLLNELFDGQLSLNIDGDDTDVTTLIKQRNIDNNERTGNSYEKKVLWWTDTEKGCEMTIFLTPNECTGNTVTVYVAVFTCPADANGNPTGEWYQLGSLYKGEAPVRSYEGGNGTGSFQTDNWRSKGDATVADGLSIENIIQSLS